LERKTQLQAERDRLMGTLQAYDGALQDIEYWLNETAKEEEKSAEVVGTETKATGMN